ncbi:bifunctional lysylphosphatidylglycerol flippase/synthetase MprF [Specibacter sp. RAF43]|uniref:bifunctional lysylphosphatidylglycerol flippase/synthetase MprF n=1 Tax=Specibacter sp. RAF43 TaxID=3233057 RepID=UPI003F9E2A47
MAGIARWVRRLPFTVAMLAVTIAVQAGTGSILHPPSRALAGAAGFQSADLFTGRWWSPFSTLVLTANPAALLAGAAVLLGVLGLAETTLGTWRTAAALLGSQLAAVVIFTGVVEVGAASNLEWLAGMRQATLMGPYAASVGALMAASRLISVLWRRRVRSVTIATALMLALYVGHAQNLFTLVGALAGLVLGIAFLPARQVAHITRSTSRETRTNLAIVVAVFAVGPLFAAVAHEPVGPLAALRNLIVNPVPTINQLQATCEPLQHGCQGLGPWGPGGHLLALAPMLLLLACAEGLRRGNRLALWMAVYLHVIIGVMSGVYLQLFAGFGLPLRRGHRELSINASVWELLPVVLVPFLIAGILVVSRRHFHIDANPVLRRRTFVLLPLLLGGFVALYAAAWFGEGNEVGRYGILGLIASLPRILLPYPFPFSYGASVYPHGFFSTLLFGMGGAVFWLVSVVSVLALFLSRRVAAGTDRADRAAAAALVRRGGDSLSWMALWPGNHYWFNAAGTVGIGYQLHYGVAVTVGGPFGDPGDYAAAVDGFVEHCAEQSLTPCFYSLTADRADLLTSRGFHRAAVATETLLDITAMEFKGRDWQNVRTALNKAAKLNISARWHRYSELGTGLRTQIHEISEDWVSGRALPEMGFTLGGVAELKDDNVQICLAVDDTGRVHGVTSWLPVFSDGAVVSWTLDFMRRGDDAFKGVMEFLIAEAVLHFRGEVAQISLSGSPLAIAAAPDDASTVCDQAQLVGTGHGAGAEDDTPAAFDDAQRGGGGQGAGVAAAHGEAPVHPLAALQGTSMDRLLALLGRTLEPVYGFQSLANFKKRFQPRHRTLYMMYQDPFSLPSIGRAVGEAYMPNVSVRQMARLLRGAGR